MNVTGRPIPVATDAVTKLIGALQLPEGMIVKLGGSGQQMTQGFESLGLAMLLSVVFIYMVLASQFSGFINRLSIWPFFGDLPFSQSNPSRRD